MESIRTGEASALVNVIKADFFSTEQKNSTGEFPLLWWRKFTRRIFNAVLYRLSPDSDSSCWHLRARSDASRWTEPRSSGSLCSHRSYRSRAYRNCCIRIRVPAVLPSPVRRSSCSHPAGQMHSCQPWSSRSFLLLRVVLFLSSFSCRPGGLWTFARYIYQYTDSLPPFL